MSEKLQEIFNNINDWLKFAEAKNAALVAVNIAIIASIMQVFATNYPTGWIAIYLFAMMGFAGLSTITVLISFLPITRIPWLRKPLQINERDNVLFYGHVANHDVESYLELLKNAIEGEHNLSKLDHAYVEQIIVNSKIAVKKYEYFTAALFFLITALATPFISVILLLIVTLNNSD